MSEPRLDWFPGLMARTKRFLRRHASDIDVCLEIADARGPLCSRWEGLGSMLPSVPRVLLLNKADLADPGVSSKWVEWLRDGDQGICAVMALDSLSGRGRFLGALKQEIARALSRPLGAKRPVKVAVVGLPNVGKSTVLNLLAGRRRAPSGAKPGLTRGQHWVVVSHSLWLLDLPGVLPPVTRSAGDVFKLAALGILPEGAYDQVAAATGLIDMLWEQAGAARLAEQLDVQPSPGKAADCLEALGRRRGLLLPGGVVDLTRAAAVLIAEYRRGSLGRISLESPPVGDPDGA